MESPTNEIFMKPHQEVVFSRTALIYKEQYVMKLKISNQ